MPTTRAAIATDSPLTAEAGVCIAEQGGNAVDIAVAAALTAAVVEPLMCSLGGSGFFMVRRTKNEAELIEGADAMPAVAEKPGVSSAWRTAELPYGDGIKVQAGHAAVAVPGFLAAAEQTWKRHGSLPWRELVQPALEAARRPVPASPTLATWLSLSGEKLFRQQVECRRCFFNRDDQPLKEGDSFQIPNLDSTLETIANQGARVLYDGELADVFQQEMQSHGGLVKKQDLSSYQARVRTPLKLRSRGFELALNPFPAVGGAAVAVLIRLIESNWQESMTPAEWALLQARAQASVLHARETELKSEFGGMDFDQGVEALLNSSDLRKIMSGWKAPNTTHFSVVTAEGEMAAVTMSMGYGAGVIIPELGICCNNSLGEPELNPEGYHNKPAGTRMVSNMAPTVAWNADGRCVVIGSPGASRITTSIAQTWSRFAFQGMTVEDAVKAPRLHLESMNNELRAQFEPGIDPSLIKQDYRIRPFDAQNMYFGAVKLTSIDSNGRLHAFADERRHGAVRFTG